MFFVALVWKAALVLELFAACLFVATKVSGSRVERWFEIQNLSGFPKFLNEICHDVLVSVWELFGSQSPIGSPADSVADKLLLFIKKCQTDTIIDLCSGSGGPSPYLNIKINELLKIENDKNTEKKNNVITTILTDSEPNIASWKRISDECENVTYCPLGINATSLNMEEIHEILDKNLLSENESTKDKYHKIRSMFSNFHEFDKISAINILNDSIKHNDCPFICEISLNRNSLFDFLKIPIIWFFLTPLAMINVCLHYWQDDDTSQMERIIKIAIVVFTSPLWSMIMIHDGIVSNACAYTKEEMLEFGRLAEAQAASTNENNDANDNNKTFKISKYEWNVEIMNPSTLTFPFNHFSTLTILTGSPKDE